MKRLMSAALVAALGVTCLGGCQAGSTGGDTAVNGKGVKIYVSLSQADAFRNTLIDAAKKTAEASGAEIVVYDAENSIENQVAQIKQAVAEDVYKRQGLCRSIVRNYLNRVVGNKRKGEHICLQGGVVHNEGIVAAFYEVFGERLHITPFYDVTRCV